MPFKDISLFSSGGHFVQRGKTFCEIGVEGIVRNISVKLLNLDQWLKRRCRLKIFLF